MVTLFVVFLLIRNRIKIPGYLFTILITFMGVQRFFIEKIRVNNTYNIGGLHITQAEIISLVLVILGIVGFWYFRKIYRKNNTAIPSA
jgi:prolipoprotein diacylglyceryltransferase